MIRETVFFGYHICCINERFMENPIFPGNGRNLFDMTFTESSDSILFALSVN